MLPVFQDSACRGGGGGGGSTDEPVPPINRSLFVRCFRIRVEHMERQLANLTGLVQKALTHAPHPSPSPRDYLQVPAVRDPYARGPGTLSSYHFSRRTHRSIVCVLFSSLLDALSPVSFPDYEGTIPSFSFHFHLLCLPFSTPPSISSPARSPRRIFPSKRTFAFRVDSICRRI